MRPTQCLGTEGENSQLANGQVSCLLLESVDQVKAMRPQDILEDIHDCSAADTSGRRNGLRAKFDRLSEKSNPWLLFFSD